LAAALAACCSCAGRKAQEQRGSDVQEVTDTADMLSTYWEGHDFQSLDGFSDIKAAEDKFDGFIKYLSQIPHEEAVAEMTEFLDSAAQNVVAYMVWAGWFEPFLHAKESPYRNDSLFVAYLDKALKDNVIDDGYMVEHLQNLRRFMNVNKVGMQPQDVLLKNEEGVEFQLSDLKGERMLILFVDADCPSCLQALSDNVGEHKDRRLVAVLVNGSQYHMSNIRAQLSEEVLAPWTFAYCPQGRLETEGLYDTSLLPFRMLVTPEWLIEKTYF
jgi:hypothetical protein